MRQLHILFNSAKTWHVIVCWFLCYAPNLPELNPKLFCSDVQNNFRFSSGKLRGKHRNQQTITCQVFAELNIIWSCLMFIKSCSTWLEIQNTNSLFIGEKKESFCLSTWERKKMSESIFHWINWINGISLKSTWTSSLSPKRSLKELSEFARSIHEKKKLIESKGEKRIHSKA